MATSPGQSVKARLSCIAGKRFTASLEPAASRHTRAQDCFKAALACQNKAGSGQGQAQVGKAPSASPSLPISDTSEPSAQEPELLSALERQVIVISRRDTLVSLETPGPWQAIARRLFGGDISRKLANPKLEALRRFAVMVRRDPAHDIDDEVARMKAAGFSERQIDAARALVGEPSAPASFRVGALVPAMVMLLATSCAFLWLRDELGDSMIAGVVLAAVLLPLLSMTWPRGEC